MTDNRNTNILRITYGAVIAAIYVVLTVLFAPISFGPMQVRIAEMMMILPMFTPAAVPGLFIGCIIANMLGGAIALDVIFGSLATLIGAWGGYLLRRNRWLVPIPPILSNALIVPFVLKYAYAVPLPIPFMMLTVCIGEVLGCGVLGILLAKVIQRYPSLRTGFAINKNGQE